MPTETYFIYFKDYWMPWCLQIIY